MIKIINEINYAKAKEVARTMYEIREKKWEYREETAVILADGKAILDKLIVNGEVSIQEYTSFMEKANVFIDMLAAKENMELV